MNDAVINLLIQVPLVGVFVAFVLFMSRHLLHYWEHQSTTEAQRREVAMRHGLDTLKIISDQHKAGLDAVTAALREVHDEIIRHDAEEKERWRTFDQYVKEK